MITEDRVIEVQQQQSVDKRPRVKDGDVAQTLFLNTQWRGPLLSAPGTRQREWELYQLAHHDYNTLFKSAVTGLTKRIVSTPWELKNDAGSESNRVPLYQTVLWNSDFGAGWESFLSKVIWDFSVYDAGAFVEVLGPGKSDTPLLGNISGFNVLDSLRCWPTADPEYPCVYMNQEGDIFFMHRTRVYRLVDMPQSFINSHAYGQCALSRCVAPVWRDVLMNRYVEQMLDDNAPPGLMIFKNLNEVTFQEAIGRLDKEQQTDFGGKWGRTVRLYGLHADTTPEITSVPYSTPPEKFDYTAYKELNVKEIALGIGLDIQDMWELTGNTLGSGTQSEVLAQKSKGRALGYLYKTLERMINQALPRELQFEFQWRDEEEDQQQADMAATWTQTVLSLADELSADERRRLLANQVEAVRDVITDESGDVIRVADADPKTPEQARPQLTAAPQQPQQAIVDDTDEAAKMLVATQSAFKAQFLNLVGEIQTRSLSRAVAAPAFRLVLVEAGSEALLDGLEAGGAERQLNDDHRAMIAIWRAKQRPFIRKFMDEIFSKAMSLALLQRRADLWIANSVNPLYYEGLAYAAANKRYLWVVNVLAEHCKSCLKLNGQIHRMKDYIKAGFLPQAKKLICNGGCKCHLEPTDAPARGRFRAVRFVRRKHA
jgi:hypothetical protein